MSEGGVGFRFERYRPEAEVCEAVEERDALAGVARYQKWGAWSIVGSIVVLSLAGIAAFGMLVAMLGGSLPIAGIAMVVLFGTALAYPFGCVLPGVIGAHRVMRGLEWTKDSRVSCLVILIVSGPIGLIVLFVVTGQATKRLRAAGYRVGMLGVRE